MLSYRHGFHAGSFVDVHKHVVLVMLLEHLQKKNTPFCYIDTHAGAGIYDLDSRFPQKNREFETGISRLWDRDDCPAPLARYLALVRNLNPCAPGQTRRLRFYPGSPRIARAFLRPADRMILAEMHTTETPLLKQNFARDLQAAVHQRDGFELLPAVVPPRERRGLVLMDPSYELRDEFVKAFDAILAAWHKWPTGIYVLWYPVQRRQPIAQFQRALKRSGIRKILLSELNVAPDTAPNRLSGSGLVIVNPPWQFADDLEAVVHWLEPVLERGEHPRPRVRWLVAE